MRWPGGSKIWVIASTELVNAVRTKAFIVGVLFMPLVMGASIMVQRVVVARGVDRTPRAVAVVDEAGGLAEILLARAEQRNAALAAGDPAARPGAPYLLTRIDRANRPIDEVRLELSERVRRRELYAFVEIPAAIRAAGPDAPPIRYHSDHPTDSDPQRWFEGILDAEVRQRRFQDAGLDPAVVARLDRNVDSEHLGLLERGPDGRPVPAQKVDKLRSYAVPAGLMLVLFIIVLTSTPALINSVLEEKMTRVSEVLLGSVTPFQLMMGKLIGTAGVCVLLGLIYVGGGVAALARAGYAGVLTPSLLGLFVLFMALAIFLYGSMYISVGAAATELKDAQSMMMPLILLVMIPAITWLPVIRAPSSTFAVAVSLFPPATPFLMLLRCAVQPTPPAWQVALSIVMTLATTLGCVWAAGRVFRVGLLVQGKSATFGQMLRWVTAK